MAQKHLFMAATLLTVQLTLSMPGEASDAETAPDAYAGPAADTSAIHRDMAHKAATDAALLAIASVQADNKLDLDIRLIGPTSVKVASDR